MTRADLAWRFTGGLFQNLDFQVAPFHLGAGEGFIAADAVDLEGDEALRSEGVFEVGACNAVEPGLDGVAAAFDADFVPFAGAINFLAGLGEGRLVAAARAGIEPTASAFVVDAAAPHSVGLVGVNLDLIAVDAAGGKFPCLAVNFHGGVFLVGVGTDLHAGVEAIVAVVFVFENEVAVNFFGAEEGVGRAVHRSADEDAVLHGVLGLAAFLGPAGEVFAVEQGREIFIGGRE